MQLSSLWTRRPSRLRRESAVCEKIPTLEARQLLAGNVTAAFSGLDLVITGDKFNNSVEVRYNGVDVVVHGLNGTKINGSSADFLAVAASNTLPGDLRFNLLAGNDLAYVDDGVAVTNTLSVAPSAGNDSTVIVNTTAGDIEVGQFFLSADDLGDDRVLVKNSMASSIIVATGSGNDVVGIDNLAGLNTAGFQLGAGDDVLTGDIVATDLALISAGAGNDFVGGSLSAGGFAIDMEAGNDVFFLVALQQTDPTRQATINLGQGNDRASVGLGGTVNIASQLYVTGSKGVDRFFLFPGATLLNGVLYQEIESLAPYLVITDPTIPKDFKASLKRASVFDDFVNALP